MKEWHPQIIFDGLVKSQRHQLLEKIGCSERRVLKGTRVVDFQATEKNSKIEYEPEDTSLRIDYNQNRKRLI